MTFLDILLPLLGGVCIGVAALLLMALNGRVMGLSGIVAGVVDRAGGVGWRLAFLGGAVVAPVLFMLAGAPPDVHVEAGTLGLIAAGLLVGFGASLGSGCTSGHGICGIARLSPRSLVATATFVAVAVATVAVVRHVL